MHADAGAPGDSDVAIDDVCDDTQADLWKKLYFHDYTEKARLAQFLTASMELVQERKAKRTDREGAQLEDQDAGFMISGKEQGGYELPAGALTMETVHSMMRQFADGERLRSASFMRLLNEGVTLFSACPNITLIPAGQKVTVVGDLHGSFADLQKVFELAGWPSEDNVFVFNGDFVDRGDSGVEVLATLLCLKISCPKHVHLNRGNHEDINIGRAYGFFEEVMIKYGSKGLYNRIGDLFCALPLCAVLENEVFIVHAGIPSDENQTIYHIGAVARKNITSTVAARWAASREPGAAGSRPRSLGLVEDLLWSDPVNPADEPGSHALCERNLIRGAGSRFGPDLARRWLQKINCFAMVRSHECCDNGWDQIDCGHNTQLFTVFSSSNYQGGGNKGAVLVFPGDGLADPDIITWEPCAGSTASLGTHNKKRIVDLICRHKPRLRAELQRRAGGGASISIPEWSTVLQEVLRLEVDFAPFCRALAPVREGRVDIEAFLDRYLVQVRMGHSEGEDGTLVSTDEGMNMLLMEKREILLAVFRLLDEDGDGFLSKEEVMAGCELLNDRLAPDAQKLDAEQIFKLIDADGGGSVSVSEFCHVWARQS